MAVLTFQSLGHGRGAAVVGGGGGGVTPSRGSEHMIRFLSVQFETVHKPACVPAAIDTHTLSKTITSRCFSLYSSYKKIIILVIESNVRFHNHKFELSPCCH